MEIKFSKYHGAGNDFVMVDGRQHPELQGRLESIKLLCDRHFGVGSDGLILLLPSKRADFYMDFYNPDGSQSLCGNGARAAMRFAADTGFFAGDRASFEAIDGLHTGELLGKTEVKVSMPAVSAVEARGQDYFANTGSPHHVQLCKSLKGLDIEAAAKPIRHSPDYAPGGTNVNFVEAIDSGSFRLRTFERGVERETLACGTGVTAAALVFAEQGGQSPLKVEAQGGTLMVHFEKTQNGYENIWLQGPAVRVFDGTFALP